MNELRHEYEEEEGYWLTLANEDITEHQIYLLDEMNNRRQTFKITEEKGVFVSKFVVEGLELSGGTRDFHVRKCRRISFFRLED